MQGREFMKKQFIAMLVVLLAGALAASAEDGAKRRAKAGAAIEQSDEVTVRGVVGTKEGEDKKVHYTLKESDGSVYRLVGKHDDVAKLVNKHVEVIGKKAELGDKGVIKVKAIKEIEDKR